MVPVHLGAEVEQPQRAETSKGKNNKPPSTEATFISIPDASKIISPSSVASSGLAAMEPPHVLVVEDTAMCWKVLKMSLMKLKCTVDVEEDGKDVTWSIHSLVCSPLESFY